MAGDQSCIGDGRVLMLRGCQRL